MRKYVLSLLFLMVAATVMGQKKSVVNLIQSERSVGMKINGRQVIKVYKGTFKQDYSLLSSDSAYFYSQDNAFDAFGNVNINQGDTLNIFSDKLNYNGNTKIAILTDNVKMIDKDATLTTNYLTYNTATRIGTYTGGGKLVNKDNTLTSKNGYYFAKTRDSYFRYNVVLLTVDAIIKTDTLKYNTGTRISYFFGPTNIYGTKDKDTLYTENGRYETIPERAYFGKKNFYKSGTKSLVGDSLFYDKLKGYGRAVKNVTFNDREQKITIKGDLGTYFKADERTLITQNAYVVMVTEQKDTSKVDSTIKPLPGPVKDVKNAKVKSPSSKDITNLSKVADAIKPAANSKTPANTIPVKQPFAIGKKDSTNVDSAIKVASGLVKGNKDVPNIKAITNMAAVADASKPGKNKKPTGKAAANKLADSLKLTATNKAPDRIKRDSIFMTADTIETQIMTYKNLKVYQENQRRAVFRDTSTKGKKLEDIQKKSKFLAATRPALFPPDTSYYHRFFFGRPKPVNDSLQRKKDKLTAIRKARQDSIARVEMQRDPVFKIYPVNLKDTARVRILYAHHHAKIFKSDLQAKADSIFYSASDSTIRCYVNPMMWTEGSQLSGDTIYLQMRNKKMDNLEMFPSAFIVNIEKGDSVHFNQVSGKKMRGFFKDDKLRTMYSAGNAESIYFQRDSGKVSGMQRSLSSRIRIGFKDNKASDISFLTKPENHYTPINKVKEDDKILKGFIWKPKDRPVSKESILPSKKKKTSAAKKPPGKPGDGKGIKTLPVDSLKGPGLKVMRDSTLKGDTTIQKPLKTVKDTVVKAVSEKQPAIKAPKDTIVNKPDTVKKNR